MKQPTLFEGICVALIASLIGSSSYTALTTLFYSSWVLKLLVTALSFAYIIYLLSRTSERVGRVTTFGLWGVTATVIWLFDPPFTLYLLFHLGLIWLIRSLYFYASMISALADLALTAMSLAAATWAFIQTDSLFLTIWSLFLVQALFITIPISLTRKNKKERISIVHNAQFQAAYHTAENAIRKLSIHA